MCQIRPDWQPVPDRTDRYASTKGGGRMAHGGISGRSWTVVGRPSVTFVGRPWTVGEVQACGDRGWTTLLHGLCIIDQLSLSHGVYQPGRTPNIPYPWLSYFW